MFNEAKNKKKKCFCRCSLQCFSSENILTEHKENCLVINGKQNVKLGKSSINFKNCSRQLSVPFNSCFFYVKFHQKESKAVIKIAHTQKNIKITFFAVLLRKLFVLILNLVNMLLGTKEKMLLTSLLKQCLRSMIIVRG